MIIYHGVIISPVLTQIKKQWTQKMTGRPFWQLQRRTMAQQIVGGQGWGHAAGWQGVEGEILLKNN